ncbi:MAG: copper-binding protein [Candidatus Thiodiazotropha sp.]
MNKLIKLISIVFAGVIIAAPVLGDSQSDHSLHGHGEMTSSANQGMGKGVLHKIDRENKTVNLTHQPIPELNWMGMTMDLQVTRRVDLSGFKPNDKVNFTVKKGRDKQFRITTMELDK